MDWLATVVAVCIASAVEMVEVVTIVLAIGLTRGWRSTFAGVGAASVVLVAITALLGTALTRWVDIGALETVIGSLLLVFGLQWLRKAILRASGYKALHDEEEVFREETEAAVAAPKVARVGLDWFAFTVAFKGVLLEGLEIVFIVMTTGASSGNLGIAAAAAAGAAVVVGLVAVAVRHPLSRVPENSLKFAVGLLLVTFGTFWVGEGIGLHWLGDDLALLWLLGVYVLSSWLAVRYLRATRAVIALRLPPTGQPATGG
jgi:uncharacterized membrane protein